MTGHKDCGRSNESSKSISLINSPTLLIDSRTSQVAFKAFHNLVPIFCVIQMCPCAQIQNSSNFLFPPQHTKLSAYILFLLLIITLVLSTKDPAQLTSLWLSSLWTVITLSSYSKYLLHVLYPGLSSFYILLTQFLQLPGT